jgi:hypothetical protein
MLIFAYYHAHYDVLPTSLYLHARNPLRKPKKDKIENVAGSVGLSLFMDDSVKWKLPCTHPSTGLSIIHLIIENSEQ